MLQYAPLYSLKIAWCQKMNSKNREETGRTGKKEEKIRTFAALFFPFNRLQIATPPSWL
jgi:hypothetical protein